VWKSIELY